MLLLRCGTCSRGRSWSRSCRAGSCFRTWLLLHGLLARLLLRFRARLLHWPCLLLRLRAALLLGLRTLHRCQLVLSGRCRCQMSGLGPGNIVHSRSVVPGRRLVTLRLTVL